MTNTIKEYSPTESALTELSEKYKGVIYEVRTTKGMKEAKAGRAAIKKVRLALEKTRVVVKADALKICTLVDTEARNLKERLSDLETGIDSQIKVEEKRKADIKAEKDRLAREELAKWYGKIEAIKRRPLDFINATPAQIFEALTKARGVGVDAFPEEIQPEARVALAGAITKLEEMHIAALDAADNQEKMNARLAEAESRAESAPAATEPAPAPTAETEANDSESEPGSEPEFDKTEVVNVFSEGFKDKVSNQPAGESLPQPKAGLAPSNERGADTIAYQWVAGLIASSKAACQYLEANPESRNHIVTKNLRAAIDRARAVRA